MHLHHVLKKFLRLGVQLAERVATPVLVAKSKKFRGALDLTYITTSSTNDDLGSAPSTLSKQGVVFGNTQRKVGRSASKSPASRKSVQCTRARVCLHTHACLNIHVNTYSHVQACILFTLACVRENFLVQGMADTKRVPGPTYYAPRLGMVDTKDVHAKTNLKSSIRFSLCATHIKLMPGQKRCTHTHMHHTHGMYMKKSLFHADMFSPYWRVTTRTGTHLEGQSYHGKRKPHEYLVPWLGFGVPPIARCAFICAPSRACERAPSAWLSLFLAHKHTSIRPCQQRRPGTTPCRLSEGAPPEVHRVDKCL